MKILATDIGGTNARIGLLKDLSLEIVKTYKTKESESIISILHAFLKETKSSIPDKIVIAAAGVIEGDHLIGTNLPWNISSKEISNEFNLDSCLLLNDFEAAAWGLLTLSNEKLVKIGGKEPQKTGAMAILGAGTGLGEAILINCGNKWKVIRTEGGHCNFSPNSSIEIELLQYLMKKYNHVSFERVLSGSGLVEIYNFLSGQDHTDSNVTPSLITKAAQEGDELSKKTIGLFCKIYGQEAGNLALKSLSTGGIYIYGGIVSHIEKMLLSSEFYSEFIKKGRMKRILKKIPVFIVKEPYLAIFGGAYCLINS